MKRLYLLVAFIVTSASVYSQTTFGIDGGLDITKASMEFRKPLYNNYQAGFHIGGVVNFKFGAFSIQPGLIFSVKGGATKPDSTEVSIGIRTPAIGTTHLLIDYIEIPLNFFYSVKAGNGNIFIGGGPYVALGVYIATSFNGTYAGSSYGGVEKTQFGSKYYPYFGNGDAGLNAKIGYVYKSVYSISLGYSESLVNISDGSNVNVSIVNGQNQNFSFNVKNQDFRFSLGYFFK
jgi:hypothetical protein